MSPDFLFYGGIVLCGCVAAASIFAAILLRFSKKRLNSKLDAEFGKRRH